MKQCNTYENKCNYKEFKMGMKAVKAVFSEDQNLRDVKNVFAKNDDQIKINDIIQSLIFEG